jgi:energy-coupling factor transport system permease protein
VKDRLGYVRKDNWIHELNPTLKFLMLLCLLISILLYPSWRFSLILLVVVLIGFRVARVSLKLTRRRTRFVVLFSVVLLLFQVIITVNGDVLGFLIPSINGFGPFLPVTDYGLERGLAISIRFLLIVLSSMLFVSVTDPTLLAHSLTRIRVPYRYAYALVIALRFLPLFDSENETVRLAQRSRGIHPTVRGFKKTLRTVQYTFFPLLVSALSRAESLSLSMDGRGFGYAPTRTYLRRSQWKRKDSLFLLLTFFLILISTLLGVGLLPEIARFL